MSEAFDPSKTVNRALGGLDARVASLESDRAELRELRADVHRLVRLVERHEEALFAENEKGHFGQRGLFRQVTDGKRLVLWACTVLPAIVSATFAIAMWIARHGGLP